MAKIDIFDKDWLDMVFADKNKAYGAYDLRKRSAGYTAAALFGASAVFVLAFFAPQIIRAITGNKGPEVEVMREKEVVIQPPPPVNPETPPPPPVEPPPPKVDQIKFPPPVVKPDIEVREQTPPPQVEDLKKADPGQKTIAGDPTSDIQIAQVAGEGPPKQAKVVEEANPNQIYSFAALEKVPEYPGGMDKFYNYVRTSLRYPQEAEEAGIGGKVFLSFVVEKDGTLTDIKVIRGVGHGLDQEAVRVLKGSRKWTPGVQNGRPVRSSFTQTITFAPPEG